MTSRRWLWLTTIAILLGTLARFYRVATLPPQAWVDEAWYNLRARDLLQTGQFHVFYKTFWGGMQPLLVDLTAMVQAMGLQSLVASRVVAAWAGVITLPLTVACLNEVWRTEQWSRHRRRITAALAALVLSTLVFSVISSRIGYAPALIPPLVAFYVWQIRYAIRTHRWLSWIWAGSALGLAQYVNLNGRFFVLFAILLALHDLCTNRGQSRRLMLRGLCLAAATSIIVASPLIIFFVQEPVWLLARAQDITLGASRGAAWLITNTGHIAASFSLVGDFNPRQNIPGRPILDALQSLGFWIGIVWVVLRFKKSAAARLLLIWLTAMTTSSLITDDAPQFERMIGIAVPVAGFVAVGWYALYDWISNQPVIQRLRLQGALGAATGLFIATSVSGGLYAYFIQYPSTPGLAEAFTHTPVDLAMDLIDRAKSEKVYVERISEAEDIYAFDYLFPGTGVTRLDFRQCLPLVNNQATRTTYVVLSDRDPTTVSQLATLYPQATNTVLKPEVASLLGKTTLIEIPPNTSPALQVHTSQATFASGLSLIGYDWNGPTVKAGESVFLSLYWGIGAVIPADVTRFVHIVSETGEELVAQHDGQPCQGLYPVSQWATHVIIPDGFAITLPADTMPGLYNVIIGWYSYPSLDRLPLTFADSPLGDNRAVIGTLDVVDP